MSKNNDNELAEEQVIDLFHNPKFLSRIELANTEEEILEIFQENNIGLTSSKMEILHNICEKYIENGMEIVDEEKFLENVAAGKDVNKNNAPKMMKKVSEIIQKNPFKIEKKRMF